MPHIPAIPPAAVEVIATTRYISAAARKLDVDRSTIHRWMRIPAFAAAVKVRREELLSEFVTAYHLLAKSAIKRLRRAMRDPHNVPAGVRAALAILKSTGISDEVPRPKASHEIERLEIGTLRVADGAMVIDDPEPPPPDPAPLAPSVIP